MIRSAILIFNDNMTPCPEVFASKSGEIIDVASD
jgi:hypothetical protein